jgi:hypothetical protein
LESASVEQRDGTNPVQKKEEIHSSASEEHGEERRTHFLTKSLAEVYAQQGHISTALDIYRRILQANPADGEAEKRISELEGHLSAKRGIRPKGQDE